MTKEMHPDAASKALPYAVLTNDSNELHQPLISRYDDVERGEYYIAPGARLVSKHPRGTAVSVSPSKPHPIHIHVKNHYSAGWITGILDCTDNCCNCWMVLCFPCVSYGQVSARVGHNGCCSDCGCCCSALLWTLLAPTGCAGLAICLLRRKVAIASGFRTNCCDDCCMAFVCGPCAMCQMATQVGIQEDGCSFAAPPRMQTMER